MPTIFLYFGNGEKMYRRDRPPAHVRAYHQGFGRLSALRRSPTGA